MRIRVFGLIVAMAAFAGPGIVSASEFRGGFSGFKAPMGFHGRVGGQLRGAVVPRMGFHGRFRKPFQGAFHKPFFRPFHGFGYLDRDYGDYGYPVVVVIQERSASPYIASDLLSVPSAGGLPVVMGIREARPDRPEIQVLNEPAAARSTPRAGARITSVSPSETASTSAPAPSSGARIVHLTVPVGSR